ncbi:MAG: ABC transporter permease [Verrucomicrobiales bacterium]
MTLPIVERELRVASRQRRTYWERFAWGIISILIASYIIYDWGSGSQAQQAQNIFYSISAIAFFYAIMAGTILTADAVSEEKREGTLGLLFLTNLKGYDVILGKLTAKSLHATYGLITIFPIMAITFLMGGVDWGDLGRMVLMLLNTLFFSLAVGIFVSTISSAENRARVFTFFVIAFFSVGLPLLGDYLESRHQEFAKVLFTFTPLLGWSTGFQSRAIQGLSWFWLNLALVHALGWICLASASFLIRSVWKDKISSFAVTSWKTKWKRWRMGNASQQSAYRTKLLEKNPITWLANRNPLGRWYSLLFISLCLALYGIGFFLWGEDMLEEPVIIMIGITLHTIFKFWAIFDSVRLFSEGKKSGALDLILSTPMQVNEIVSGYWHGLLYQFRWGVAALLLFDMTLLTFSRSSEPEWVLTCFVGIILLIIDLMTIGWLGMWLSLTRKAINAVTATFFYILVLPWVIFIILLISRFMNSFAEAMFTFLGISLLIDFVFYQWSSSSLKGEFRNQVANQFGGAAQKQ